MLFLTRKAIPRACEASLDGTSLDSSTILLIFGLTGNTSGRNCQVPIESPPVRCKFAPESRRAGAGRRQAPEGMADATVDAWLVARDHRSLGPLTRTLWLLDAQKRQAAAEVTLPPPPPEAQLVSAPLASSAGRIGWLYAEHRVVVLIDARRHCLLQQVGSRLETLLGSLAAGPRLGDALQPTLHVSVALAARAGAPLRVLLQGYRHRCGDPAEPLCAAAAQQLRLAAREPRRRDSGRAGGGGSGGSGAVPSALHGHSLHQTVEQGLFCLSLLPAAACPALALLTDCVGAPLDAPLLPLTQRDVGLLVVRLPPPAAAGRAAANCTAADRGGSGGGGGERRRGQLAELGLLVDAASHQLAAEGAGGLLLELPEPGPSLSHAAPPLGPLGASVLARALLCRVDELSADAHGAGARGALARWLVSAAPRAWLPRPALLLSPPTAAAAGGGAGPGGGLRGMPGARGAEAGCGERLHRERLHTYELEAGCGVTADQLLAVRLAEGFVLLTPPPLSATSATGATDAAGVAAAAAAQASDGGDGSGVEGKAAARWVPPLLRLACQWSSGAVVEYRVHWAEPETEAEADNADGGGGGGGGGAVAALPAPDGGALVCGGATATTNGIGEGGEGGGGGGVGSSGVDGGGAGGGAGALRVRLSVVAPIGFWLRVERLLQMQQVRPPPLQAAGGGSGGGGSGGGGGGGSGGTPHDTGRPGVAGDAEALLLFVEQVRHRDRRLRALAAASAEAHSEGAGEAWRRAHEIGALRDLKLWSALSPDAADLEAETVAGAAGAEWAAGGGGGGGEEGGSVLLVPRAQLPAHVGVTIRLDLGAYLGGGGGGGGGGSVGRLRLQLCVRDGAAGVARAQARRQMGWTAGCRRVWHALPARSPYRPCACHVICMHGMGAVCA